MTYFGHRQSFQTITHRFEEWIFFRLQAERRVEAPTLVGPLEVDILYRGILYISLLGLQYRQYFGERMSPCKHHRD